jgi:hypothetical protein
MNNPVLGVDTYEDGGAIDEALLFAEGVSFMVVRLNNISGGHHRDALFDAQWAQAARLPVRILFFVYNPWVDAQRNFDWLVDNAPSGVQAVAVDVEVPKPDYPPAVYAAEVDKFHDLVRARWRCLIYTGFGSLPLLASWPVDADYWWAQYPAVLWPASKVRMSWSALRSKLLSFSGPMNADKIPGRLAMWQCSGDKLIMDGCEKAMDVNVWMGSFEQLVDFAGVANDPVPVPVPDPLSRVQTHDGIVCYRMRRFGAPCVVHVIDLKKVRVLVSPGGFRTVGDAVALYGAQLGVNGGGWPNVQTTRRSNELWASDGVVLQGPPALDQRPYINVTAAGVALVHETDRITEPLYNAWGFDRLLGMNGVFNTRIGDRTTKDARTGTGVTLDGQLVLLSCSGNDREQYGLTFPEMWEVLHEFGAHVAGNNDGGSSATVVNTAISGDSLITQGEAGQSRVINQVLFFADGAVPQDPGDPDPEPPPTGDPMPTSPYIFISSSQRSLRSDHSPAAGSLQQIPANFTCDVSEIFVVPDDVFQAGTKIQAAGDRWAHVTKITGPTSATSVEGWTAVQHLGVLQGTLTPLSSVPPPSPVGRSFTLTIEGYKPFSGQLDPE